MNPLGCLGSMRMVESLARVRTSSARSVLHRGFVESHIALGLAVALVIGGLAFANGGYFPVSWGWAALALLWMTAVALAFDVASEAGSLERRFLGAGAGLAGWIFLSLLWTASVPRTILEGQRMVVYLGAAMAGVLLLRRSSVTALLVGIWAAITVTSGYGVLTRLFPDRFGSYDPVSGLRLSDPVGYWNAFGILAAMGALVALGLAARSGPAVRCVAGGSTVVITLALYFTFSRGGWIALFAGLAAAMTVDRRRLQLITTALVLAPWCAITIWVASSSSALTRQGATVAAAVRDGHGLAAVVIAMIAAAALAALALDWLGATFSPTHTVERLYGGVLLFILAAVLIVVFGRYGLPPTLARKAYHAFNASPTPHASLNGRLFSLSGTGRSAQFHIAWQQAKAHPVLGGGAGTFDIYWFQHRQYAATIHDAHNLYLETLSELGPPGLALLTLMLGVPLAAVRRARSAPLASVVFAAYVAFLLHAAVDWDWEMPAVTLTALGLGLALMALARQRPRSMPLRPRLRWTGLAAVVALVAFALVGLLGNEAISASSKSNRDGHLNRAESQARRAMHFAPWSPAPWRRLGEAQLNAGQLAAAQANFQKAIANDPRDWTLWFELATTSRGKARARALAQASRLNPLSPEIAEYRAQTRGDA
jgi:O-antigen ligase/polysaccharide polymerase Wzy-like membrane protein/tetratricopeptide repeat protein